MVHFTLLSFLRSLLLQFLLCIFFISVVQSPVFAGIKKWTGSAGDQHWSTATNWNDNTLPQLTDDVIFDNSIATGDYTVQISGSDSIRINSLTISPNAGTAIRINIDTSCTREVSLSLLSIGYSLVINNGGFLINASRVSSGAVINMADSMQINDGGWYKHASRRPHAALVIKLSRKPGTEHGVFEFDLPSGTGTLSISNRVYGTLVLSAVNAGGTRTYTGTGSNPLTINGDMIINQGISFSLDLGGTNGNMIIKGNVVHKGVLINLASGAGNNTVVKIAGDIMASPGSQFTETNTGLPVLELNGSAQQHISIAGTVNNNVSFRVNNPAGIILQSALALPYRLELMNGMISTTAANLLTLQAGCSLLIDSTAGNRFIDGPLRKEGLSGTGYFLFPVGQAGVMRWIELKNATGNFEVEFIKEDPGTIGRQYGQGIDHISSNDYWKIHADNTPGPSAAVELSFADAVGSGVTDMNTLRVAQFLNGSWTDRKNITTTGTGIGAGSIVSETINGFDPAIGYFALASSIPNQNPLPVRLISFSVTRINKDARLEWEIDSPDDAGYFNVMTSGDNRDWHFMGKILPVNLQTKYQFTGKPVFQGTNYYRLEVVEKSSNSYFSKAVSLNNDDLVLGIQFRSYSVVNSNVAINVTSPDRHRLQLIIFTANGKQVRTQTLETEMGMNPVNLDVSRLPAGIYYLVGMDSRQQTNVLRFVKQ